MEGTQPHQARRSFGGILPALGVMAAMSLLMYRFFMPQPSAPLAELQGQTLVRPGEVQVVEIASSHCPSCVAMAPIIEQVRRAYADRAIVRVLYVDKADDHAEATRLGALAAVRYTPTFLVFDRTGHASAKFIGPTSFVALSNALDGALASKVERKPG